LKAKRIISRRYRNRRIGEFLKELEMTEGRGTGIPKIQAAMKRNGSPKASFETDENRLWFVAKLPIHTAFAGAPETQASGISDTSRRHVTDHVSDHLSDHVRRLLHTLANGELSAPAIMRDLKLTHRPTLRANYLHPALEAGLVEMTSPESPRSRQQKYRLTAAGRQVMEAARPEP
jgi:ATP-dependent DNA helicase RecG